MPNELRDGSYFLSPSNEVFRCPKEHVDWIKDEYHIEDDAFDAMIVWDDLYTFAEDDDYVRVVVLDGKIIVDRERENYLSPDQLSALKSWASEYGAELEIYRKGRIDRVFGALSAKKWKPKQPQPETMSDEELAYKLKELLAKEPCPKCKRNLGKANTTVQIWENVPASWWGEHTPQNECIVFGHLENGKFVPDEICPEEGTYTTLCNACGYRFERNITAAKKWKPKDQKPKEEKPKKVYDKVVTEDDVVDDDGRWRLMPIYYVKGISKDRVHYWNSALGWVDDPKKAYEFDALSVGYIQNQCQDSNPDMVVTIVNTNSI